MTTLDQVRAICQKLPGAVEGSGDGFGFGVQWQTRSSVKVKGFVWSWRERVDPKKPKVPNLGVLAVMTPNLTAKSFLLESDPEGKKIFTEPHYNGFCAVLVRLDLIEPDELEDLIYEAWKRQAPKKLIAEFEG